jgi:Domain of unknown function (DUF1840)
MIYKFKSSASGDVIMLGPQGDQVLRLLGREPTAKGIIETTDLPAALQALHAAMQAQPKPAGAAGAANTNDAAVDAAEPEPDVALRQRLWPMVELLRRSHAAQQPVVWGV